MATPLIEDSIDIDATPEQVWSLVSDLRRMGEWSPQARKVLVRGEQLHLTPKEFDLLRYLVMNPNRAIPHRELLQAVWGPDYGDQVEYLRVFIKQLRRKIEAKPDKPVYLLTEPWIGYRFAMPEA